MARLAVLEVADEVFRSGDRALAIDVARAIGECRVAWDVERRLRALTTTEARTLFARLSAEIGNGASFSRVAAWLTANEAR